jgi:hypothetical protein
LRKREFVGLWSEDKREENGQDSEQKRRKKDTERRTENP